MFTVVYGTRNGTQDSIAWWICNEDGVGPQIYKAPFYNHPWKGFPNSNSGLVQDSYRHPEHTECHRLMENIRGDILAPMRQHEENYDMLVWSNYFGCLKYHDQEIVCDKLIICEESSYEDAFHYCLTHAFKGLDHDEIDEDSELWWTDHKLVNGEVTDSWKEVWYKDYHDAMHDALDNDKLKYMWQLNYMHWDLHQEVIHNRTGVVKLNDHDDYTRLLAEKLHANEPTKTDWVKYHNPDSLLINDPTWWDQGNPHIILDYLELRKSEVLMESLDDYIEAYKIRREWFDELVSKTF